MERTAAPVLLLATNAALAYTATRCLQDAGRPFRMLSHGRYVSARASRWCRGDTRFAPEALAGPGLADLVAGELQRHELAAVVPAGIAATLYLSRHKDALPPGTVFPVADHATLTTLNDKWAFHQLALRLGLPQPATFLLDSVDALDAVDLPGRVVAKPLAAEASQGVVVLDDVAALRRHVTAAAASDRLPLLVQDFVPGVDQGASALVDAGRIVAQRVQRGVAGQTLDYLDEPDIADVLRRIVEGTRFTGVLNVDFRRDSRDGSVVATEVNPRLFFTAHMMAWSGANLLALGLDLLERPDLPGDPSLVATRVLSPHEGTRAWLRRRPLNAPSRAMLRAEARDPLASAVRRAENALVHRWPAAGAWLVDEPPPLWAGSWDTPASA